jgi:hypothetical protein
MARRKQEAQERVEYAPAGEAATQAAETVTAVLDAPEAPQRTPYRDVREQKTVRISPGPDGDKLRLLRSDRFNQMQISPDGELPDWARERLTAEGWRDRVEDEGIYTRQLPPRPKAGEEDQQLSSARRRAVFDAERFFEELANDIRADRKMPPVRLGTAAAAER